MKAFLTTLTTLIILILSVSSHSMSYAQSLNSSCSEECIHRKNQYLDYAQFKLNTLDSDEFNTSKNVQTKTYLNQNGWRKGAYLGNHYDDLDSISYSAIELNGSELVLKTQHWKTESDIPFFKTGKVHKKVSKLLGVYELRVKLSRHVAITHQAQIKFHERYQFDMLRYSGSEPFQLPLNSWHYFPNQEEINNQSPYPLAFCKDKSIAIEVYKTVGNSLAYEKSKTVYHGKKTFYEYECNQCGCFQKHCTKSALYDEYHTIAYVVTPNETAIFLDGILIAVNKLGGADSKSVCPIANTKCQGQPTFSLANNISPATLMNNLRDALALSLEQEEEVAVTIDYFRKYDFKSKENYNYTKEFKVTGVAPLNVVFEPQIGLNKLKFLKDGNALFVTSDKLLAKIQTNGALTFLKDDKTQMPIKVGGDFALSEQEDIFFMDDKGYIQLLEKNENGSYSSRYLANSRNKTHRAKETPYNDLAVLKNGADEEVVFRTHQNQVGRYFKNRGKWYFMEMTSKTAMRVDGDLKVGNNGKIFYRGEDGFLHGFKVKGKNRQTFHIDVRPLGEQTPKVAKSYGAFTVSPAGEIVFINTQHQLVLMYIVNDRYSIKSITPKNNSKCEQAYGALVWSQTGNSNRIIYHDKSGNIRSYITNNSKDTWYADWISLPFPEKENDQRLYTKQTILKTLFPAKQSSIAINSNSKLLYFNKDKQLVKCDLVSSETHSNDKNYAPYIDKVNECEVAPKPEVSSSQIMADEASSH